MRWYLGAFALTAAFVALIAVGPLIAAGVIAFLVLLAIYILRPKIGAGVSVVGVLFGSGLATSTHISALGYLDETLVLLPFVIFTAGRVLRGQMPRWLPGLGWLLAYLLIGGISSAVNDVPFSLAAQSSFLILKGFVFAFAVAQLDWTTEDVKKMIKPAAIVLALVLLISVVNLAIPETWTSIFSRRVKGVDFRLGLPSLIGPFDHEVAYGQFMALAAIAVFSYRQHIAKGAASAILLAGSCIGLILSFRRKAIAAAPTAALLAWLIAPGKRRAGSIVALVIALPIVTAVAWDGVASIVDATYNEYFLDPTSTARTRFYSDGFALAQQAFPLGLGFGRFGSYMAGQEYSPVYVELGYNLVYGLAPGDRGPYLSDTFWPAIVGEAGYLGLVAFIMALVSVARQGSRLVKAFEDPYARLIGAIVLAWSIEFFIESVAAPVYNAPPVFTLFFGVAGLAASLLAQQPAKLDPAPLGKRQRVSYAIQK